MKTQMSRIFLSLLLLFTLRNASGQTVSVWKLADLKAAVQNAKEPTIVNFWATFCKPCLAELPHFQALANAYKSKGLKLFMVSLDLKETYLTKVASAAKKLKLTSPVVFLDETDADVFCPAVDSSWSGVIPATLIINNAKGYRKFFEEELSKEYLEAEIKKMLRLSPAK